MRHRRALRKLKAPPKFKSFGQVLRPGSMQGKRRERWALPQRRCQSERATFQNNIRQLDRQDGILAAILFETPQHVI
jgi:hypothetical protein